MKNVIASGRKDVFVHITGLIFIITIVFGSIVKDVASAALAIFLLASFYNFPKWKSTWRELGSHERILLVGFIIYTLSCVVSYINVEDNQEYLKQLSRYARFTLFVPIYLVIKSSGIDLSKYFMFGVVASGPVMLAVAIMSMAKYPELPASGQYHHIIFGGAAALSTVTMLVFLITIKLQNLVRAIIAISAFCALYACIMSQSRGAWAILPVSVLVLFYYSLKCGYLRYRSILTMSLALVLAIMVYPEKDMYTDRISSAVSEVQNYYKGSGYDTSVGQRLALWDVAFEVWAEHPVVGTGPGDFNNEIVEVQEQGVYEDVGILGHSHSVFIQALAVTGLLGFSIMIFALFVMPYWLFHRMISHGNAAAGLSGIMLVVSFFILGLTGDWASRAPMISIYMIFLLANSINVGRSNHWYSLRPCNRQQV